VLATAGVVAAVVAAEGRCTPPEHPQALGHRIASEEV
jgi:hypothetical protein